MGTRMSGWPRWASDAPSHSVTSPWTIDCGCTTTSMRSYGVPNRWWASITSSPLFMSVAESIVIFPPMAHVGWRSASLTPTSSSSARARPRNGPPEAVITSRSTAPGASPPMSWCRAECSESTGMSCAPVASASGITRAPPTTSDSLLASATSMPSVSATTVGPRPAEPTIALSTRSAPDSATSRTSPSGPASTSPSVHASAARAAASPSPSAMRSTPCWAARPTSASCERSAESPTSSNSSPARATTSSACRPIEPVAPRIRRRRIRASMMAGGVAGSGTGRSPAIRPHERTHEPQADDHHPHEHGEHPHLRAAVDHVRDEQEGGADGHRQEAEPGDHQRVGRFDQPLALGLVEAQPVRRRGRDQACRRDRRGQQRHVEDVALEARQLREALRERDREQEREEDLHAGERHPQLVEQLDHLAIALALLPVLPV